MLTSSVSICDNWKPSKPIEISALVSVFALRSTMAMTLTRCTWRGMNGDPFYEAYHDEEWGVPEYDSRALWEKLVLDGFQAGLAWITILR